MSFRHNIFRWYPSTFSWMVLLILCAACSPVKAAQQTQINAAALPAAAALPTQTPAPFLPAASLTPTAIVHSVWVAENVPQKLRDTLHLPAGWNQTQDQSSASVRFISSLDADSPGAVPWVYALAASFPTLTDGVSATDLKIFWQTGAASAGFPCKTLLVDPSTLSVFTQKWGEPAAVVQVTAANGLVERAWAQPGTWAILPFEQLEPRWKVLLVDGQSPVEKTFQPGEYPLTANFAPQGEAARLTEFLANWQPVPGNRQADHLTTVMLTGVTALVRGTASFMETRGIDYPASKIGDWLREADILHISNEVAFADNCPLPHDWVGLKFCSRNKYIQLLEDIGTDVVELSGDHFQDWGDAAVLHTIDLYNKEGWKVYGGGVNIEDARKPALFDHHGNKIAFLGCNAKPPGYAKASETTPGALHCDMNEMSDAVKKVAADGYAPIVTFQHLEYYSYTAHPILQKDFRQMADAGAVIVSGSQAHQPQAFELRPDAFLHYGLGNLFFDQTNQGEPPRTAFIDRHVFYEGKHISTDLLTIYFVDYALSRPMTPDERQTLLATVFKASGW